MSTYIYLYLETQDGERRYDHKSVHVIEDNEMTLDEWADDYCHDFWAGPTGEKNDMGWYEFDAGCIWTRVSEVKEITVEHYNVLKSYLI